jgi:hypothetical protein
MEIEVATADIKWFAISSFSSSNRVGQVAIFGYPVEGAQAEDFVVVKLIFNSVFGN